MIVRRAIYDIDSDITKNLGSAGGGAGGTITMASIKDLVSSTALSGQILTKMADGSFGFSSPQSLNISMVNMANAGANTGRIYGGANTSGAHQFRAIQVVGGTLTENTDRLTITMPAVGEVNTLGSLAGANSISIVGPKNGTVLNTYGIRGTNGVTVVRDLDDIVISGSGTGGGGGTTGGEANTGENIGAAGTNVVRVYADKVSTTLRFRSILFNLDHFTVTGETSGQYTVNLRRQKLSDSPDTDITTAVPGHVLRLESDNIWRGQPLPPAGITSIQADPAPKLGGDLVTAGKRIIGIAGTLSGMIEKPKLKTYTLILKSAQPITISSISATCRAGTVNFFLFLGDEILDNPDGELVGVITGQAGNAGTVEVIPPDVMLVPAGSRLSLRLSPQAVNAEDFIFSITHASA